MSNYLYLLVFFLICCGSGLSNKGGRDGTDGSSCTTTQSGNGAKISCTDGTSAVIVNGDPGPVGSPGPSGADAQSCTVMTDPNANVQIQCPNGTHATITNGASCEVTQTTNGATITCGNEIAQISNGVQGLDGQNCKVSTNSSGSTITCPDGSSSQVLNGQVGSAGKDGSNGINGQDCSVVTNAEGALVSCGTSTVQILNGVDGKAGKNGTDGSSITAIKLCADSSSSYPEYGIVIGSSIYAVYYGTLDGHGNPDGKGDLEAFLAKLTPGSYISTNGSGCHFSVNADGTITR